MVKVVVGRLRKTKGKVGTRRVRLADGQLHTVRTLNAQSGGFAGELGYVFAQNVKKARSDNRRLTGSPDVEPKKR